MMTETWLPNPVKRWSILQFEQGMIIGIPPGMFDEELVRVKQGLSAIFPDPNYRIMLIEGEITYQSLTASRPVRRFVQEIVAESIYEAMIKAK